MSDPVINKYPIKQLPIDDMLGRCDDVFGAMLRGAAKHIIQHTDFEAEINRPPTAITLTVVTPAGDYDFQHIHDWLHTHYARGGTLSELCAWVEQHSDRAAQFSAVLAPGTILHDGVKNRRRIDLMPYGERRGDLTYLEVRSLGATWRSGSSFLAVLDADNPPSS